MEQKKIDMTTGPIMTKVFLFAISIVLGNILQYLYTTVDILVIGNYCGDTSLACSNTVFGECARLCLYGRQFGGRQGDGTS